MKTFLNWLDTSTLAGILLIVFFGIMLFIAWKGRKNVIDYPGDTETDDAADFEIMRNALHRKLKKIESEKK